MMKSFRILLVLTATICCSFGYSRGNIDGIYYDTTGQMKLVVCKKKIVAIDEERGDLRPVVCANYSWADKDFVKLKNKRFFKDIRKNTVVKKVRANITDDSVRIGFKFPDSEKYELNVNVHCDSGWSKRKYNWNYTDVDYDFAYSNDADDNTLGKIIYSSNLDRNVYLYEGKERIPNLAEEYESVYDFGARYYNPLYGRWFAPDPER